MAHTDWFVEANSFGNCNCGYACPCQFEADPTHGHCRGFEVLDIQKGHFGSTDLTGLKSAILYAWPGPIYEGGGAMQIIIGEEADAAQRDALATVLQGGETDEEATHWWVFRAMCDTVHAPLFKRISFDADIGARRAKISIADVLESTGRPIRPPHSADGAHRVRIELPHGIEFRTAEIGSASTRASGPVPLDLEDTYGQWAIIRHGPHGVPD